jgi:hypothetical protein
VEKDLVVRDEMSPVTLPRPYEQVVLKFYHREVISADCALGLPRGTFDEEALPDLPMVPEAEIWKVTSWAEVATAYVLDIYC